MPKNISSCTRAYVLLMLLLFATTATRRAFGQSVPLVFNAESTCASFTKPAFAPFAQLPAIAPLPDPFLFLDGSGRDTAFANWERHRCDYKAAIETYEIGPKPDPSDVTVTSTWTPSSATDGTLRVVVTRKSNQRSLTLTSHIVFPSAPSGKVPAVIGMALSPSSGPATGSVPSSVFTGRGIAAIEYLHNQVTTYAGGQQISHTQDPFYLLYPELCAGTCSGTSNSGQYAAWSWGVSRLIDGLFLASANSTPANPFPIDLTHLGVTGCSYAGKMALFSVALDERVALTIAQENGGGGMPSWRVSHVIEPAGSVEDIDTTDYSWFGQQMRQFAGDNVNKLPDDHHELMALVLPRALLVTGNTDFTWLSNRSGYIDDRATQQVYQTFGIADRFGFYIDGGHAHCAVLSAEVPALQAFVDKFQVGNTAANTDVEVNPFSTLNFQRWTSWWGTGNPVLPPDGGDFSLSAAPASVSVAQGSSATSTITVTRVAGFTGTPTLTASGLPSGVTASFSGSVVTFTAAATAAATTTPVTVTITGVSGTLSHTTTIALSVTARVQNPDFSLSATPTTVSVSQGSTATSTITVTRINSFSGTVTFTATGLPAGVTASFSGNIVTFTAAANAPATTTAAAVTITGASGALSHTTSVAVGVTSAAPAGSVSAVAVVNSTSPFFDDEGVRITNTAPITALTVTITVQNTGGLTFSSQYNTAGGAFAQGHNGLTYTFTLSAGQTLNAGTYLFDAQIGGSGTAHPTTGDTYTATGTAGGAPFTLSGHF